MPATIYYDKDADLGLLQGKKVAVLGYGSQGHAHALNLRDSGIDVRVGLRDGSSSKAKAEEAGLKVLSMADAAAEADLIMFLLPDTEQRAAYEEHVAPHLQDGDATVVTCCFFCSPCCCSLTLSNAFFVFMISLLASFS